MLNLAETNLINLKKNEQEFSPAEVKKVGEEEFITTNTSIHKEDLQRLFEKIQKCSRNTEKLKIYLICCQLNYEIPIQVFFNLKDFTKLRTLNLKLSYNSLKTSFLKFLKEALFPNNLKSFCLELASCRELNPDFLKIFDEKFFEMFAELRNFKLNISDNSRVPEVLDLTFLSNLIKLQKVERLSLDLSKNYVQHWKKLCNVLPNLKKLKYLKLNFYGIKLSIDYLMKICDSLIKCDGLDYIKVDFRQSDNWVQSDEGHDIAYIEAMISIFRQKFENDSSKFKIWF